MAHTTISSRDFNRDAGGAKRSALEGPVFITDRGKPAHVLLSIDDYRRLTSKGFSLAEALADEAAAAIEFDPPRVAELPRPATFV